VRVRGSMRDLHFPEDLEGPLSHETVQSILELAPGRTLHASAFELSADPEFSRSFPRQRAARVEIETTDGRKLAHVQETRKGDPELPLSDAELDDKYVELVAPVLGDAGARALLKSLWALETLKNVELDTGARQPVRAAV